MDRYSPPEMKIGGLTTLPARGGMISVRERSVLEFGQKSQVTNMRCWYPGFETRKGYTKNNTTAYNASSDSPLNLYQFTKGKVSENHFFVQFGDTKLLEASNTPPGTGTTFGTEVHDGSTGQIPASFANINDYMIYSNGADQHQIYAGQTQKINAFIVVKDTEAHDLLPFIGEDYSEEVSDGDSSTVAILDSLSTYDDGFIDGYDAIYIMSKTPLDKINWTVTVANSNTCVFNVHYWNGAWTSVTVSSDTTKVDGVPLAQSGTITLATTAPNRTDEIPRYMFNQSGFWYRITLNLNQSDTDDQDLTTFTEVDEDSDITLAESQITVSTMRRDANSYVYYDMGADNCKDFYVEFSFEVSEAEASTGSAVCGFSNTVGSYDDIETAGDGIIVSYFDSNGSSANIRLKDFDNGDNDSTASYGATISRRYCKFFRYSNTCKLEIYTDASMETLEDTLTITCNATDFRYFYVCANLDKGTGSTSNTTTWTGYDYTLMLNQSGEFDSEVEVSEVTYDCESFTDLVNVWNGTPIDLIEAQLDDDDLGIYERYGTSAIRIDDMTSSDALYLSSTDPLEAIYFDFGDTPNQTASVTITIQYWDGDSWADVTEVDGTNGFMESGWISFGRQTGEFKRQFKDTRYFAYWYKITVSDTLSDDVVVGVTGMPYFDLNDLGPVGRVSGAWKNRALYTFNRFPRDIYVSQAADHMMLNGNDYAILQPGDGRDNATVGIANFYNEIIVFQEEKGPKGGCVTIFEGYSPATFGKLVLSNQVGSLNAKSFAVVDGSRVSLTLRDQERQTMCYFLSHYGVFATDGRTVTGISDDIQNYFDPRFGECIRAGYENEMWLAYDASENVLKMGLVSGSSATTCNKFFVYDLTDGVWYEDSYADSLSCFATIEGASGQFHALQVAAGSTTGFIYQMNNGTTDAGTAITWTQTFEFNKGPFFLNIEEFLTRFKVSDSNTYSFKVEEADVQVINETADMSAYASSETIIRNRHLVDIEQRSWVSITLTGTGSRYLLDCGILVSAVENK